MSELEHRAVPTLERAPARPEPEQAETPYLDALRAYADREPARLHVPGHKGGPGADPGLRAAIGEDALRLDIPALTYGIDAGTYPRRSTTPRRSRRARGAPTAPGS